MLDNQNNAIITSYEYATDSYGWNITKNTSTELFKLFQLDIEKSTDKK